MAGPTAIEHTYRYPFSSQLLNEGASPHLQLATSQSGDSFPHFFEGRLLQPRLTAHLLTTLARVVSTRYYMPPNMVARLIAERDPVVTAGAGLLRFEGFSACCSTYVRVDLTPDAYAGDLVSNGTTNVDFNPPMRAALARVREGDRLSMSVGPDEVTMKHGFQTVVERKVELPLRWLKGFVEVQAYQSTMEQCFDIGKLETLRFLRSLLRTTTPKTGFYVVQSGKGLRLSQVASTDAVPVTGLQRLQLFADLAPFADGLRIYRDPSKQSSEWRLQLGPLLLQIALTAEVSRGFSGEGQVLSQLSDVDSDHIAKIRAGLKWQSLIDCAELARQVELSETDVRKLLALLGSRGLVGYDVSKGAYFHREMPFDLEAVEEMHPRLQKARNLIREGKVAIVNRHDNRVEIRVTGNDVEHTVVLSGATKICTCPWHSKYQGLRGPCKHVLAAELAMTEDLEG